MGPAGSEMVRSLGAIKSSSTLWAFLINSECTIFGNSSVEGNDLWNPIGGVEGLFRKLLVEGKYRFQILVGGWTNMTRRLGPRSHVFPDIILLSVPKAQKVSYESI
jgi:hypothetical protein